MKKMRKYVVSMLTILAILLMMSGFSAMAAKISKYNVHTSKVVVKKANWAVSVSPEVIQEEGDGNDAFDKIYNDFVKNAKITVTFSGKNKKYAKKISGKNTTHQMYKFTKAGTYNATITINHKGKKQTFKRSCLVLSKSPIKSIKWGNTVSVSKHGQSLMFTNSTKNVSINVAANKGWKIKDITYSYMGDEGFYIGEDVANKAVTPYKSKQSSVYITVTKGNTDYTYYVDRLGYKTYVLNYKKMTKDSAIRVWYDSNVSNNKFIIAEFTYNKKASSKKYLQYKNLNDLNKKMKKVLGTAYFKTSKKGNKLTMKVPYYYRIEIVKPGKGTKLTQK